MRGTLFRHLLLRYLGFFLSLWGAVLAIFLVTDFVDRAKSYEGPNWVKDASVLYGFKALVVMHQVAPGVLLVAAAVLVSSLRKRGELTALKALAFGPSTLVLPVALVATVVSAALIGFDDWVVARANWMVDEITATRFHRWGDWRFYAARKQWFRHGDQVFNLQAGDADEGFGNVTILTLAPDFSLRSRLDAKRMVASVGTRWRLFDVEERTFDAKGVKSVATHAEATYDLGVGRDTLNIRPGKPEQMRMHVLRQQIRARRQVGLPDALFRLALANRFAYPLTGIPAALLAMGVALRRSRSAGLTAAFVEGLLVATVLWGLMVVARSLVIAGRVAPPFAAWAPVVVLAVACIGVAIGPVSFRRWGSA